MMLYNGSELEVPNPEIELRVKDPLPIQFPFPSEIYPSGQVQSYTTSS
jgi:hypothetical protein